MSVPKSKISFLKIIFFSLAINAIYCEEQVNATQQEYIPIFEIKHRILKELIPHILTDLVIQNDYVNDSEFRNVLVNLNINITESFILELLQTPGYEVLLQKSETKLSDLLRLIIDRIPNTRVNFRTILELLKIDQWSFTSAYTYGEEEVLYELLNAATYDEAVLPRVFKLANTSLSELVRFTRIQVIEPIINKSFKNSMEIFGRSQVVNLLNQTLYEVQISDVRNDSLIYEVLTNYTNTLNSKTIWAVETKDAVLSIPKAHIVWKDHETYVEVYLQNVEDRNITRRVSNITLEYGQTYSTVQTNTSNITMFQSNITRADDYSTIPEECTVWALSDGKIRSFNATNYNLKDLFIKVLFQYIEVQVNLGSPLICDGKVYGILTSQNNQTLSFRTLGDVSTNTTLDFDGGDDLDYDVDDDIDDMANYNDTDDHDGSSSKHLSILCALVIISALF